MITELEAWSGPLGRSLIWNRVAQKARGSVVEQTAIFGLPGSNEA